MRDFVSTGVVRVCGLAALLPIAWSVLVPHEPSWRTLGWVSLLGLGALLVGMSWSRSIRAIRDGLLSMPRERSYPLVAASVAIGVPVGLLLASALVTLSSVAALVVLAGWCGRSFDRLLVLSNTDPLTGLLNRRGFGKRVAEEAKRGQRYAHASSMLCVDIDGLKVINDTFGHRAGDRALGQVGRILSKNTRAIDAVARLGGDEFAVLLPQTSASQTWALSQRILADVARCREGRDRPFAVSIGISELKPTTEESAGDLMASADAALYRAKAAGGGQAVIDLPTAIAAVRRSLTMEEASVSSSR